MAGGGQSHRRIERRALVGTTKAKTKTSKKGKVKNINPSFLLGKYALTTPISSYTVKGFKAYNREALEGQTQSPQRNTYF